MDIFDFLERYDSRINVTSFSTTNSIGYELAKVLNPNSEFASELSGDMISSGTGNPYSDSGIEIQDFSGNLRITYRGALTHQGSEEIFCVLNPDSEENNRNYPMSKIDNKTLELLLPYDKNRDIHFSFRDSKGNSDNNSGRNYFFDFDKTEGSH